MSTAPAAALARSIARATVSFALLGVTACGAAPPPDLHAAFARIQEHEAVIAHRAPEVSACATEAPCPAEEAVCAAAASICAIADDIDDPDAHTRCALAQRRCPNAAKEES